MTLVEKAAIYQRDLESRPRRHAYVTVLRLSAPGRAERRPAGISDNDGLWTALYVAAQSFRFAVTRDPAAREQATRSMAALLRLESITGLPGFPARAISHPDEPGHEARSKGEWRPSPVEPGWLWKGDTSSDEIDGHFFALRLLRHWSRRGREEAIRPPAAASRPYPGPRLLPGRPHRPADALGRLVARKDQRRPRVGRRARPESWRSSPTSRSRATFTATRASRPHTGTDRPHGYALNTLAAEVSPQAMSTIPTTSSPSRLLSPLATGARPLPPAPLPRQPPPHLGIRPPRSQPPLELHVRRLRQRAVRRRSRPQALQDMPLDLVNWPSRNTRRADLRSQPPPRPLRPPPAASDLCPGASARCTNGMEALTG